MKTTMAGAATGAYRSLVHGAWARFKRPALAITVLCAAGVPGTVSAGSSHLLALFPSASSPHREGFARIINHSDEPGTVRITGIDDAGVEHGPVELWLEARATAHFNSADLEAGRAEKGLSAGLGDGEGDWRLHLSSELDIEPLSYIRTGDGLVTAMHQVVPSEGGRHYVRFFNPGSNASQVSRLRLVNPAEEAVEVTIEGRDDAGEAAPGGAVGLTLAAGQARTLTAQALESGGADMTGSLGDGTGKWQLLVSARGALEVMSLLASPTGHLSNLSAPGLRDVAAGKREHELPLFMPAADAVRQGFARIINYSDESGTVRIYGIDDAGQWAGPVRLSLEAGAGAHFNSADLESGNAGKALSGVLGAGTGSWRLRLYTELDIEALAYVRTADGFVTTMHERVRESARRHHVAFFNPGGNRSQVSRLRLVNPTEEAVEVAIAGRDDAGEPAPGGAVGLTLAPGEARTLSAQALESGGAGMTGSLGDGTGKWQLFISSAASIEVMNLLRSPTGHLSNLSVSSLSDVASVDGVDQPVALNVIVIIPAEVTTVEASDLETTVLGAGTDGAPPREAPSLLVASDDGGAVMYALVNEDGGLLGEEAGTVRVSVGSTAVVLVAFAAGYRIPSLTPQVVDAILSHADYGVLVRLLTRLMSADKNYLVRLSDYPDVVELLKRVAGSLSAGVALRARPGTGDAAPRTPTTKSADTARSALPHGIYKPGFYCTWALVDLFLPGEWCSPWDEHEPWRWFGNARGAEAYKPDGTGWKDWLLTLPGGVFIESYHDFLQEARQPPFLARSDKEGSREVHAAANPSFIGYAMELYEGSQYVDYYYVPGNATTVDKLQNSGAAYRELLAGRALSLSGNIDRIRFERYRLTATTNDAADYRALVVSFLNTIKLFVSVVNVATDFSVVDDWLREIASTTYYNFRLANCARSLLEHVHPTDPSRSAITQAFALFLDSALASFSTLVTDDACRSVVIEFGGEKLKEDLIQLGIDLGLDGAISAVTGAKPFADAANELVPVATSYFLAQARSEYHVQWERTQDGQPYIARVSEEALPVAQFSYRQLRDFNVEFDGSESQGEGLRYEWKVAGTPGRISTWEPRQVHDFAHAGTFGVTLTVTDRNGITAEESGQVTVTAGRVPVVSRLTCTPTGEGTEFSMHAEFSDPDDDIESVEWYSHIRNRHPEEVTGAGQRRVTLSAPRDATHTRAKVRVVDALENEAERNCEVNFDPGPPSPDISDASAEEGDSLVFTVRLDPAPAEAVIYWYATYRRTAGRDDYEGHDDTQLRFGPGERSKTITVSTYEDSDVEGDETFYVYITDDKDKLPDHGLPTETDYLDRATGTIRDNVEDDEDDEDDEPAPPPRISRISDASAEEGDSLVFTVRLDRAPAEAVSYWYATYRGTAGGDDYDGHVDIELRFGPGERSKTITVPTKPDSDVEGDETFYVYITDEVYKLPLHGLPTDYLVMATGTIRDADEDDEDDEDDDSTADCPGDREVLVTLYNETGGDRWRRSDGWLTAEPLSNWHGVEVNAEGCVTAVDDLHSNNLRGAIPEELGNLANLESLYLHDNRLTGAIPEELGNLANLEILRLHYNRLAGAIPKELGNLANLESLYLHDNRLTGAIPEELGNLANLERLHLDENRLTGAIPEELGNLANLRTLHLDENRLTGAIPEELGNLANLRTLHLDENRLTGAIPEELGNLANLRALHLDENQLTGAIPEELGNLANLERLHLDENRLTGAIPEELGNLANLGTLYLDENRLTGVLRAQLTNLTRLSRLRFHDNDGLCAPDDASFQSWLQGVPSVYGPTCDTEEAPPRPRISNASAEEGEALVFTVTLDRTPSSAVIYWYETYPHTASGDDYDELEDTELRFGPGERSKTITVSTKEDSDVEGDETFYVYITDDKDKLTDSAPSSEDYLVRATGTIRDDDEDDEDDEPAPPAPRSISDASAEEGDSLVFTVRLDRAPAEAVIYWYATYPHTASGDDYDELEDTELQFGPGERSKTITVSTIEDSDVEGDETFYVYITDDKDKLTDSTPSEDYLVRATGTIRDDDEPAPPVPRISNRSAEEGDSLVFTVTLDRTPSSTVTYWYATYLGTAASNDYTGHDDTALRFGPGQTSRTITVRTTEDTRDESDETFYVYITDAVSKLTDNGYPSDYLAVATGTIRDDDEPAAPSISNRSAEEGDSLVFTVTLDRTPSSTVTYWYATYRGTAANDDYTGHDDTALRFGPGQTSRTITVRTTEDTRDESDETFYVYITDAVSKLPDSGRPSDYLAMATGTIRDDDEPAAPRISNRSAEEGDSLVFTVTLDRTPSSTVTYWYATYLGTAASNDYTGHGDTALRFGPGQTSRTITVRTTEDTRDESDETFYVYITDAVSKLPDSGRPSDYLAMATGTIRDDDEPAAPRISNRSAEEGDSLVFTVTLDRTPSSTVTYWYATYLGTAASNDYTGHDDTALRFGPGQTSRTITVRTTEDTRDESDETFYVYLTDAVSKLPDSGRPSDYLAMATGTIRDDDEPAAPSISNRSAEEGDSLVFTVTLDRTPSSTVTYWYATYRGTAASNDYTGHDDTALRFGPGQTSRTITVRTTEDTRDESDETFYVYLTDSSSKLTDNGYPSDYLAVATGTIRDDDEPPVPSISNRSAEEGDSLVFTVTLDRTPSSTVTYWYATYRGTAASNDYTGHGDTALRFGPGQTSRTITVRTTEDTRDESDETFYVYLTDAVSKLTDNGYPSDYLAVATGTIRDDDEPPTPRISNRSAEEGDSLVFTVTLDRTPSSTVTYWYATYRGTAANDDYTGHDDTALRFGPGQTSRTITVRTTEDTRDESDETFYVYLTDSSSKLTDNGYPSDYLAVATGTIRDDDEPAPPVPRISNRSAEEGDSLEFTVTLDRTPSSTVTYWYATYRGTAASNDYTGHDDTALRFSSGQTSRTITVRTTEDTRDESDETFYVYITDAVSKLTDNGYPSDYLAVATGTIRDDDEPAPPVPRISNRSAEEGDSLVFTVTLDRTPSSTVTYWYATYRGTAASNDYTGHDDTALRFGPGQTSRTITVRTTEDTRDESDETFYVYLTDSSSKLTDNGYPSDYLAVATGTIRDDDEPPVPSISNRSAEEGDSLVFTVTLDRTPSSTVTYWYATYRGTAASNDYTGHGDTALRFSSGQTSRTITVRTTEDTRDESDETFYVYITDAVSKLTDSAPSDYLAVATGTIRDDDDTQPAAKPDLVVSSANLGASTVEQGDRIRVDATVTNQGGGDAGSSRVGYYVSRGGTNTPIYVDDDSVSSLDAGESDSESDYIDTDDLELGRYFVLIKADDDGDVTESNENNNTYSGTNFYFTVAAPALPDLVVSSASLRSRTVEQGDRVRIDVTIRNQGSGDAGSSRVAYYAGNGNDTFVREEDRVSSLRAGRSDDEYEYIDTDDFNPGAYVVIIVADDEKDVEESDENNNTYSSTDLSFTVTAP